MTDDRNHDPLGSSELERDRRGAGQDRALADELATSESNQAGNRDGDEGERAPDPIAGTMLPPD